MSTRYKTWPGQLYYTTTTVVGWIDVFTRQQYVDILYDSIRYCQQHKELELYAYVIMPNHFHLICRTQEDALNFVMRDPAPPGLYDEHLKHFSVLQSHRDVHLVATAL